MQIADWIDDKLYSTVQLANASTSAVEAFGAARSQPIPGGTRPTTRVDTNVLRSGDVGLPQSWEMLVYGISARITRVERPATGAIQPQLADGGGALSNAPTLQTLLSIDRLTYLEFSYNNKVYSNGTMMDYPQGGGYSVFSTNANFELAQNGVPSPRDRNALVLPIPMREGLSYKMVLSPEAAPVISQAASDGGAALTFADAKITLSGLIKKNVV